MYFTIDEVDGYIEEKNRNKYLTFASTDKNKEVLKKYAQLRNEIKSLIDKIDDDKPGEYGKEFMKIKCNSDDNLPLNEILTVHMLTVIVRSVFQKDCKYYPQVFLDECLYEL